MENNNSDNTGNENNMSNNYNENTDGADNTRRKEEAAQEGNAEAAADNRDIENSQPSDNGEQAEENTAVGPFDHRPHRTAGKGKKRKKKRRKKILRSLAIIAFVLLAVIAYAGLSFKASVENGGINIKRRMRAEKTEMTLTIEYGESVKSIAKGLKECGAIDSRLAFLLKCKRENIGTNFNFGEIKLNSQMTFEEIVSALEEPNIDMDHYVFTVKEGMTQKEIAAELERQGIVRGSMFMSACDDYGGQSNYRRESCYEGYLFPDTYEFALDTDACEIRDKLLDRFKEIYNEDCKKRALELGFTDDEIITVASIIEKEARYPDDRKKVASVIYNRLKENMPLQMDSTVLYALGENKDRVLKSDTEVESDYNTYYIKGLPAGPISNPGKECIMAALYPDDTDYLYYVLENEETGQHFFTGDYNEFLKAKERYVSKFD